MLIVTNKPFMLTIILVNVILQCHYDACHRANECLCDISISRLDIFRVSKLWPNFWLRNTQHNDIQHNNMHHNGTQHNDTRYNYAKGLYAECYIFILLCCDGVMSMARMSRTKMLTARTSTARTSTARISTARTSY
jgi:hypothetical protein